MVITQILLVVIRAVTVLIEVGLSLRILLRFLGASTVAPFVAWVYDITAPLVLPFAGMFPSPVIGDRFVIDISSVVAMIVYVSIGLIVSQVIDCLNSALQSKLSL